MDHRSSLAEEISKGLPPEDGASGGYEHEFVGEVEDEYKCCICLEVMRDPYQIVPCGHRCCKSCLGILLRKYSNQASCPIDRETISLGRIFPDNNCRRKISNMKMKCGQGPAGCNWQGELSNYKEHVIACLYVEVSCPHEGCTMLVLRKEQNEHEGKCEWRVIPCEQCLDKVRAFELKQHKRNECPNENVPCQNGCRLYLPRSQMTQHIEDACPETFVNCPLKSFGCTAEGARKDLKIHFERNQTSHLETLCEELANIKMELKELKALYHQHGSNPNKIQQLPVKNEYYYYMWNAPKIDEIAPFYEACSTPYSTGPRGYCFTIAMLKRHNDTVLSIKFVPGIYDNLLPWPFRCDFTIALLDQQTEGERSHIKKHVDFSDFASDSAVPKCYHQPGNDQDAVTFYPLLIVLNDTLKNQRYSPNGSALVLVKVKSYNCEENLGL